MPTPPFAAYDLGMLVMKVLAVLGGFAVGWLAGDGLLRLTARFLLRKKEVPRGMRLVAQVLGGVALAWGVWLWVSGTGGGGPGQGGLFGPGFGLSPGKGGKGEGEEPKEKKPAEVPKKPDAAPDSAAAKDAETLRIDLLGGQRVREERFYVLAGEEEARTLAGLRDAVVARRRQADLPPLRGIEIMVYENSVARDHPAVRDLERWARENDLTVSLSFPKRELP
jgi:hypothetical protein